MKGTKKILGYALGGAVAVGSLISGGCRAAYVKETPQDREHYAVYEKTRTGNYANSHSEFVSEAVKSLDDAVDGPEPKRDSFDSYKATLGIESVQLANYLESKNNSAKSALSGADVMVKNLYNHLNKTDGSVLELSPEQRQVFEKSACELESLAQELGSNSALKYSDLINLQNKAKESGDKKLIDSVNSLIADFTNNVDALRVRVDSKNALLVSEGIYNAELQSGLELGDSLNKLTNAVGYREIAPGVLKRLGLEGRLTKDVEHMGKHLKRDSAIDPDDMTRVHRYDLVKTAWQKYTNAEISDKELDSVVYAIDSAITAKALEVQKDSNGKKTLKFWGAFFVPGLPHYKAAEAWSFMGAKDTAEEAVLKERAKAAKKGEIPGNDGFDATMNAIQGLRLGMNNGSWVVGKKRDIRNAAFAYTIQAAGQTMVVIGAVESLGSGSGSSGGGSHTAPDPAPAPDPWGH